MNQGQAQQIQIGQGLRTCPACQYADGFHVSFSRPEGRGPCRVILICPQCSAAYDVGWSVTLSE